MNLIEGVPRSAAEMRALRRDIHAHPELRFDFNDELLPLGPTYWVRLVERYLGR